MLASNSPISTQTSKPKQNHQDKSSMGGVKRQESRISKAYNILDHVTVTTPTTGIVKSSDGLKDYHVVLSPLDGKHTCECPDNTIRGNICKHIIAFITKQNEPTIQEPKV